jgi:hypothetical protein
MTGSAEPRSSDEDQQARDGAGLPAGPDPSAGPRPPQPPDAPEDGEPSAGDDGGRYVPL